MSEVTKAAAKEAGKAMNLLLHPGGAISSVKNTIEASESKSSAAATAALTDALSVINSFVQAAKTIPGIGPAIAAAGFGANLAKAYEQLDEKKYIKPDTICDLAAAVVAVCTLLVPATEGTSLAAGAALSGLLVIAGALQEDDGGEMFRYLTGGGLNGHTSVSEDGRTSYIRNADGSNTIITTSENGKTTTIDKFDKNETHMSREVETKDSAGISVVLKEFGLNGMKETITATSEDGNIIITRIFENGVLKSYNALTKDAGDTSEVNKKYGPDGTTVTNETVTNISKSPDGTSITSRTDYENGKIVGETKTWKNPDGSAFETKKEYDGEGKFESETLTNRKANGDYTSETYNKDGNHLISHEHSINSDGSTTDTYTGYNPNGSLNNKTIVERGPDGSVESKTFTSYKANGDYSSQTYDKDGNPLSSHDRTTDADGNITDTHKQYDADGNLKSEFITKKDADGNITSMEIKDGNGNTIDSYEAPPGGEPTPPGGGEPGLPPPIEAIRDAFHKAEVTRSPLILDLDGDGVETVGVKAGAYFDHDGDGFAEQSGWVGKDDGLLVMDRNNNGLIDSGAELFGDNTLLENGTKAANGFAALSELDTNHDGLIDAQDATYTELKVWKDANGDGYSEAGELFSLADTGVASIATGYSTSTLVDASGNVHKEVGSYTGTDGATAAITDVWFAVDRVYTIATEQLDVPDDIAALPNLRGYGNVYDLHQAMVRDTSGTLKGLVEQFIAESDAAARNALTIKILYAWTGVADKDPNSRAATMIYGNAIGDARKLYAMEALLSEGYEGTWCWGERDPNPHGPAAAVLLAAFDKFSNSITEQLLAQTRFKAFYDTVAYKWDEVSQTLKFYLSGTIPLFADKLAENRAEGKAELVAFITNLTNTCDLLKCNTQGFQQALELLAQIRGRIYFAGRTTPGWRTHSHGWALWLWSKRPLRL